MFYIHWSRVMVVKTEKITVLRRFPVFFLHCCLRNSNLRATIPKRIQQVSRKREREREKKIEQNGREDAWRNSGVVSYLHWLPTNCYAEWSESIQREGKKKKLTEWHYSILLIFWNGTIWHIQCKKKKKPQKTSHRLKKHNKPSWAREMARARAALECSNK